MKDQSLIMLMETVAAYFERHMDPTVEVADYLTSKTCYMINTVF
jgi:hypothetical protein